MSNKIHRRIPVLIKKLILIIKHNKLLSLILLIGTILRLWGIYPGYPFFHSDESMSYHNAIRWITNQAFAPDVYAYPLLVVYIHIISYVFILIPFTIIGSFFSNTTLLDYPSFKSFFENVIIGSREINVLYWGRYTNAVLGVVSIFVTYLVGKKYFNTFVGLVAALLLSVNYRHVLASHFALHDIPNNIFLSLAYLSSLKLMTSNSLKDYLLAGIISGLSFSVKYSPLAVIAPIIAHLYKFRKKSKFKIFGIFVIIAMMSLTFFIINFSHFINFTETYKYIEYLQIKYNTGHLQFLPFPYFYLFKYSLAPLVTIFVIAGIFISLLESFKKASILLIPIILFFISLTVFSSGGIYVRNFTLVLPVLLIFAAIAFQKIFYLLGNNQFGKIIAIFLLAVLIAPHIFNSIMLDTNYAKNWNLTEAKYAFEELKNNKVAGDNWFWDVVLGGQKDIQKIDFNIDTNFTYSELQEAGADYVLVDTGSTERFFTWWMAINNTGKFVNPIDLMYETFPGGVFRELISLRTQEFIKPWQAYESNIFLIPILPRIKDFKGEKIYEEDFESKLTWEIDGARGQPIRLIQHIDDNVKCLDRKCIYIGPILKSSNIFRALGSVSLISPIIEIESNKLYRVMMKIRSDNKLTPTTRDGFFKVELYKNRDDYRVYTPDDIIFMSSRVTINSTDWQEKEVFIDVPHGYKFMAIKLQTFGNTKGGIYYDEITVDKSVSDDYKIRIRKSFPADIVFINSII